MKVSTSKMLDNVASILASEFVNDCLAGHTTRAVCDAQRAKDGCRSDVDFIKSAIRHDRHVVQAGLLSLGSRCNVRNVLKSTYQFNYLANETMHRLRMRAQRNPEVRNVVDEMFGTRK